jgi:hypothetical protein
MSHAHDSFRSIFTDGRNWPDDVELSYEGYSIDQNGDGRYNVLETRDLVDSTRAEFRCMTMTRRSFGSASPSTKLSQISRMISYGDRLLKAIEQAIKFRRDCGATKTRQQKYPIAE